MSMYWTPSSIWSPGLECHLQLCRHKETNYALKTINGCLLNIQLLRDLPMETGIQGVWDVISPFNKYLGDPYHQRILRCDAERRKMWPGRITWTFPQLFLATCSGFSESSPWLLQHCPFSSALSSLGSQYLLELSPIHHPASGVTATCYFFY